MMKKFLLLSTGDGTVRFRRFAGAEFARLYQDVELERSAYYSLTYAQRTEHGALDKLLVIFRGADGKWREKSRLTDVTPLVNGEWTAGKLVFQVPPDVNLARIDFRLDSAGTVELKDIMLEKLDPADGKAYLDSLRPAPFQPGRNSGDLAVKSDSYQVIAFAAQGGENGTRPRKKAAKRQGEAPGQGIQRGQRPGVPLGQHAEAGQHAPDGQQMPRQLLHKTEEVKVPRHRQRDRQCQPARGPKGRLPGSGAAADAGGSLDGQQKDHGKGGHGPAAVTANLPKQDAAQVKVGQRITAHHRPGPKALIFGYT